MRQQQEPSLLKPDMLEHKLLQILYNQALQAHFKRTAKETVNTDLYDALRYFLAYFAHEEP